MLCSPPFRSLLETLPQPIKDFAIQLESSTSFTVPSLIEYLKQFDEDIAKIVANVLGGDVKVSVDKERGARILYTPKSIGLELELFNSSAMVANIASMLLSLHMVRPGTMLFVEEPESQLHPEAQRVLAWVIALLASHNIRVVVTTHSDYMLTELAAIDRLKHIDEEKALSAVKALLSKYLGDEEIKNVFNKVKKISIAFYYFNTGGEPQRIDSSRVLVEIPSMTEQIMKQLEALRAIEAEDNEQPKTF